MTGRRIPLSVQGGCAGRPTSGSWLVLIPVLKLKGTPPFVAVLERLPPNTRPGQATSSRLGPTGELTGYGFRDRLIRPLSHSFPQSGIPASDGGRSCHTIEIVQDKAFCASSLGRNESPSSWLWAARCSDLGSLAPPATGLAYPAVGLDLSSLPGSARWGFAAEEGSADATH